MSVSYFTLLQVARRCGAANSGRSRGQLVERVRTLLQSPHTSRQATYDLRRLRRKGLIAKVAGTQRYQLASLGRRVAVLFTKTYGRVLAPGLSVLDPRLPEDVAARNRLSTAWRGFERGRREADEGKLLDQDEVETRMNRWLDE